MKYVINASAGLKAVLMEQDSDKAVQLRSDYLAGIHELIAPDFYIPEVGNALIVSERRKVILPGEAAKHFATLLNSAPAIFPAGPMMVRAMDIALQSRMAVYDCLYVVLADEEGCKVVTSDQKLLAAFPGSTIDLANL